MNDSDPRPMPPQVLAAYRDPLDLRALLASGVFTDSDRLSVRDELLQRLITKHGNIEVEIGYGSKTMSIRKRVAQFKKNAWGSIEILLQAEEFGGREAVLLELAAVMQPHWAMWWDSMRREDWLQTRKFIKVSSIVLGQRQIAWLAAQYARSFVDLARPSDRRICVDAIEAAEAWSIVPSESNRERAEGAFEVANASAAAIAYDADASRVADTYAVGAACAAAYVAATATSSDYFATNATMRVAAIVAWSLSEVASNNLHVMTKQLITPTLITKASRGLR